MQTQADKNQENKSRAVANTVSQKKSDSKSTFQFEDNRPTAIQMRKLKEMVNSHSKNNFFQFADNRPEAVAQRKLKEIMNNSPRNQRIAQFQKIANENTAKQEQPIQKKPNNTGLPDNLKTGMENLSGYAMDDVKVHYNSDKPAQLNAHAYSQGTDIHIASGQEKHLPHEAWHVVQQKQGRVKPTMQMNSEANVNSNKNQKKSQKVVQMRVRKDRTAEHSDKPFHSSLTNKYYKTRKEAEDAEEAYEAQLLLEEEQEIKAYKEEKERIKKQYKNRVIETDSELWGIDRTVTIAHDQPRDPKYTTRSTTSIAVPYFYERKGFGRPVISEQRHNQETVDKVQKKLKTTMISEELKVIKNFDSGEHSDPYSTLNAFAGDYEDTEELPNFIIFGVSKGRCNDCDDFLNDFPIIMDSNRILGESTKQWNHSRPVDLDSFPLTPIDQKEYGDVIKKIRENLPLNFVDNYKLTEVQIDHLGGRRLTNTIPDGDCSINAVLESMEENYPLNELRSEIAILGLEQEILSKNQAFEVLEPGHWTHSNLMLTLLAQILNVQITIIDKNAEEIKVGENASNRVFIYHVEGNGGADHYYGSKDS